MTQEFRHSHENVQVEKKRKGRVDVKCYSYQKVVKQMINQM